MLTIAEYLVENDPEVSVLLLTGSPMVHAFRLHPQIDYVKLPSLARTVDGDYVSQHAGLSYSEVLELRAKLIKVSALAYQPEIVLVDKKPAGLQGELKLMLAALRESPAQVQLFLVLRDILDAPESTRRIWLKNNYYQLIEQRYSQVLVLGDQRVFDMEVQYAFSPQICHKLTYCGYLNKASHTLNPSQTRAALNLSEGEKLVLVMAGGGADGVDIFTAYLEGLRAAQTSFRSLLVAGPEMDEADRARINHFARDLEGVKVVEFLDDIERYIDTADLVVSMGGYNTVVELLSLNKRAIIIPRQKPGKEQWIRAKRLAELGMVSMIDLDDLHPAQLIAEVKSGLLNSDGNDQKPLPLGLDGLEQVRAVIEGSLTLPGQVSVRRKPT